MLIANDEAVAGRRRPGGRDLEPVPPHVRRGLERPAPRDDGRHPGRPLRQPEHRRHRPDYAPARRSQLLGFRGAPGNTINDTTSYWVPNHAPEGVRRAGRRRVRHRLRPGRRARARRPPASTRSAGSSPTSACSTSRRPTTACACGRCTPASRSTRSSRPPASSWSSPDDVPESRLPTDEELALLREVIDPDGTREPRGPDR